MECLKKKPPCVEKIVSCFKKIAPCYLQETSNDIKTTLCGTEMAQCCPKIANIVRVDVLFKTYLVNLHIYTMLIPFAHKARSTKGAVTSQPRATPWVTSVKMVSPERAEHACRALSGLIPLAVETQGVALGWLVFGPLALPATALALPVTALPQACTPRLRDGFFPTRGSSFSKNPGPHRRGAAAGRVCAAICHRPSSAREYYSSRTRPLPGSMRPMTRPLVSWRARAASLAETMTVMPMPILKT